MTARFASAPIGTGLVATDGGLTLTTTVGAANLNRTARSDVSRSSGTVGAEFTFWGDADLLAAIGAVQPGASLAVMVGADAEGVGWKLDAGTVYSGNTILASGLAIPAKGEIVGVRVLFGSNTIEFYHGATLVHSRALPVSGASWHFAVSLGSAVAGQIACAVNSGQWLPRSAAAVAGWALAPAVTSPVYLSDYDYLTAASDAPAHTRYEGVIEADGLSTYAEIGFWPWGGNAPRQGGVAQLRVLDANGLLDTLAQDDVSGIAVAVRIGTADGTLASSTAVARFVCDHVEGVDDARKTIHMRDANDDLDKPLSYSVFLPSIPVLAWRPVPVVIGAVASVPALAANSDGSVAFLSDAPLVEISTVLDRGDPMVDADWAGDPSMQQLLLGARPIGPVVADVSTIGVGMTPATLQQALENIFNRAGIAAWSTDDALTIDLATGYAGIGYYASGASVRQALAAILPSYGAWWWQDAAGVIRFVRVVDPAATADIALAFDLQAADLEQDLVCQPDAAPNLSRRMAFQPNAFVHGAGDFVTDLDDVPPQRRVELGSPYRGQAYSAAPMAARYRHADAAQPMVSCFWRQVDAQAEINRVCSLYAVPRFLYLWRVRGDFALAPTPGSVGRITYPRYGLSAGRKVMVRSVERNPATGDVALTLWGA